jgi:hypothetical protein
MPTILRAEKAAANHAPSESPDPRKARNFSRLFNESGYIKLGRNYTPGHQGPSLFWQLRMMAALDEFKAALGLRFKHKVRRRKGGAYPLSHFGLVRLSRLGHDVSWVKA